MSGLNLNRRQFIQTSVAVAGAGLIVGCSSKNEVIMLHSDDAPNTQLNAWVHIAVTGTVTITVPSVEMGQGVKTSMAMIVADEMDADWSTVNVVIAPWNAQFNNPAMRNQITGGSTSISSFWLPMRQVGAVARQAMLAAAAKVWGVNTNQLITKNGQVFQGAQTLNYSELAEVAATLMIDVEDAQLKQPSDFNLIGKAVPRVDGLEKVTGQAEFGIDVNLPDMLVATVAQAPVFGGKLVSVNKDAAMKVKGVRDIVEVPNGIAVLADSYWQAKKGLAALAPKFDEGDEPLMSNADITKRLNEELDDIKVKVPKQAKKIVELAYEVPYLAHATMEPMTCTAHVQADRCDIWAPTQSQSQTGTIAEDITGLKQDEIFVHTTYLGGGFGRRGEADFVEQAVLASKAVGRPVKVIWSREEDTQHDYYRPATVARFQIGLDENNRIMHWGAQTASTSILKRLIKGGMPSFLKWIPVTKIIGDPVAEEGMKHVAYVEEPDYENKLVPLPIPVGFWRSVGHSSNGFFVESAIDEVAVAVGADPYQFRRDHLTDAREIAVMEKIKALSNWGKSDPGRVQGISLHKSFGTYIAEVVELSVSPEKEVTLHKITAVLDCGVVVNPDTVKAQIEGGIIFGLTAVAEGDITIEKGRVKQSNFHDYKMLKLDQIPEIVVEIIPSAEAPSGIGEPGTPPIAAAMTNALFQATGERITSLPIAKHGYKIARARG
ncbi:molybdopterin-dependent oxidoreductase [Reinekea forsetii]|nr:molybdopterin-dependent oxidoreductase [Reinekea forsetii]